MPNVVVVGAQHAVQQSLTCGNGKAMAANMQPQLVEYEITGMRGSNMKLALLSLLL